MRSRCYRVLGVLVCLLFIPAVTAQIILLEIDPSKIGWEVTCDTVDDWRDSNDDPGMGTLVDQAEMSVIRVRQTGDKTWGKTSYLVENIDIHKYKRLEVRVNEVALNSAFIVGVAPKDWSDFIIVIERSSAHGVHTGNIWRAVKQHAKNPEAWEGEIDFHLVVVIEGADKATLFDNFAIHK